MYMYILNIWYVFQEFHCYVWHSRIFSPCSIQVYLGFSAKNGPPHFPHVQVEERRLILLHGPINTYSILLSQFLCDGLYMFIPFYTILIQYFFDDAFGRCWRRLDVSRCDKWWLLTTHTKVFVNILDLSWCHCCFIVF